MMRGVGVVLTGSKVKTGDVIFDRPDFPQSIDFVTDFTKFRRNYPETTLENYTHEKHK
jgi:hypothetical protein